MWMAHGIPKRHRSQIKVTSIVTKKEGILRELTRCDSDTETQREKMLLEKWPQQA